MEGERRAFQGSGDSGRLEAGQEVVSQRVRAVIGFVREIRGQVPVVPAVVPADDDFVSPGCRACNADRGGHGLATRPGKPCHLRPGMNLCQQARQFDFVRGLLRGHGTEMDAPDDGRVDVRVREAQDAGQDAGVRHVCESATVRIDHFTADGLLVVRGPLVGSEHLRPL